MNDVSGPILLFDLDGTLTDPFDGITRSLEHALDALGHRCASRDELRWCIGPPLRQSFATMLATSDRALIERAIEAYRERYFRIGLFENQVYDGVPAMLATVQARGYRALVVTSKVREAAERVVAHFGLAPFFERVYGSDPHGALDDKGDLIAHLLDAEGIDPQRCVMIGDRLHDILAARRHGISTVGVTWGYGSIEELTEAGADVLCEMPEALVEIVETGLSAASGRAE
jgi:phosphoglycolate phosphatase